MRFGGSICRKYLNALGAVAALLVGMLSYHAALAQVPIVTDSRIKTFVYNENEVFTILTHYGYQSNIELGANEEIETVSVGDRVGWQIISTGRRLFIRAMEENAHTNMTVVTNKRAYQFDLRSSGQQALLPSEELVYVVRFYYPDEPGKMPPAPVVSAGDILGSNFTTSAGLSSSAPLSAPVSAAELSSSAPVSAASLSTPGSLSAPVSTAPINTAPQSLPAPIATSAINYNYTFAGPQSAAPLKIYDDGRATYFKLHSAAERPQVAVIAASGEEMSVPANVTADGVAVVNVVAPRFAIKNNGARVVVYNEKLPGV